MHRGCGDTAPHNNDNDTFKKWTGRPSFWMSQALCLAHTSNIIQEQYEWLVLWANKGQLECRQAWGKPGDHTDRVGCAVHSTYYLLLVLLVVQSMMDYAIAWNQVWFSCAPTTLAGCLTILCGEAGAQRLGWPRTWKDGWSVPVLIFQRMVSSWRCVFWDGGLGAVLVLQFCRTRQAEDTSMGMGQDCWPLCTPAHQNLLVI